MRLFALLATVFLLLGASAAPAAAQVISAELTFWESVRDSKDRAELEAYLKAYPDGKFAPLAQIRLNKLKGTAAGGAQEQPPNQAIATKARKEGIVGHDPAQIPDLVERVKDAVVNISATRRADAEASKKATPKPTVPEGHPLKDLYDQQKQEGKDGAKRVDSLGSGFVIDPSGIIATNNHVIEGADGIFVNFSDGTKLEVAKIVGRDAKTNLALLKVKPPRPLPAVRFGDSSKLRVGQAVIAIGNPFGLGGTVTSGIVSALNRDINAGPYDDFIQTDAAINRGNSGGPLFNLQGEVIGINTVVISATGGSVGIGFALPSDAAVTVIEQLKRYGETRRGWLGVRIQLVTDEIAKGLSMKKATGALVEGVTPDSPAAKAGVEAGDVIVRFDGRDVPNMRTLPRIVARTPIGKAVSVEVLRRGKTKSLRVTIGLLPEQDQPGQAAETAPETGFGDLEKLQKLE